MARGGGGEELGGERDGRTGGDGGMIDELISQNSSPLTDLPELPCGTLRLAVCCSF